MCCVYIPLFNLLEFNDIPSNIHMTISPPTYIWLSTLWHTYDYLPPTYIWVSTLWHTYDYLPPTYIWVSPLWYTYEYLPSDIHMIISPLPSNIHVIILFNFHVIILPNIHMIISPDIHMLIYLPTFMWWISPNIDYLPFNILLIFSPLTLI